MNEVLKDSTCKRDLKELQDRYVIVPIDKATGNVAFVCKRFYAIVLLRELGLIGGNGSPTYECNIQNSEDKIMKKHKKDLTRIFKLDVPKDCMTLPHIYWLPKLHKNPIKFRFIIAAPNCSVKPLSKVVTKIFKLFYHQISMF